MEGRQGNNDVSNSGESFSESSDCDVQSYPAPFSICFIDVSKDEIHNTSSRISLLVVLYSKSKTVESV